MNGIGNYLAGLGKSQQQSSRENNGLRRGEDGRTIFCHSEEAAERYMAATSGKNSAPRQRAAGLPGPARRPAGRPYGPIQPYTVQRNVVFCEATCLAAASATSLYMTPVCDFTLPMCVARPARSLTLMSSAVALIRSLWRWCLYL